MKKTVYFILQHLCTGGVEICVTNVANALVRRGYQVVFLSLLQNNELAEIIDPLVKIDYLTPLKAGGNFSVFYKLRRKLLCRVVLYRKLRKIRESIVISTRNEYSVMVSKLVSSDNLKIAQLHHDYIDRKEIINDFKYKYNRIDYFFILTDDVRVEIMDIMKGNNTYTKCVTVPNFIPRQISLRSNKRTEIALAVGRLSTEKGFLRLLDVWKLVDKQSEGKYQLYIIGEGSERMHLEMRIKELKLHNAVRLLGLLPNSEVAEWMQKSRIYCMSSFTEAFSMVLLEAMGNGLPQVAFDVRVGPRNLILEGETGYLVKDGDIETYAARVLSMFSDSNQWQKMSIASKLRFNAFSEKNVIDKWEQVFNRVSTQIRAIF